MTEYMSGEQGRLLSRGRHALRLLGMVALVFVAGCKVVPKAPPQSTPTLPTEQPVTPGLPTDANRHRIALLVPLSGTNAGVGESIANAANLAVLDTGGQRIRVTTYDTALGAAAAAQKAIAEGNKLILGPLLADDVRAVAPIGRAAHVPLIGFSNDITVAGNGTYLMGFLPTQSVDRVVGFARSKGITNFAALVPNGVYGQRASTQFLRSVEAAGGQVVSMQNFDRNAASIMSAVAKLGPAASYDAVLIADSGRMAIQAVPLIRKNGGSAARILGTELWNAEGSLGQSPAMRGAWFASVSDGLYNQLASKYRARYGKGPYRLASLGYDSVLLATKIAGDWRVGTAFPLAKLADQGGFAGIDGAFRFRPNGIAERALEVQQINAAGFSVVAPAPRSFDK
jgi:branched-chain amino acid transport system substrate-binding protein